MHYHFVSEEEFDRLVADDELLEWAVVHRGARYGTPRQPVLDALAERRPALLEIDLQGARQVRERMPRGPLRLPGAALVGGARAPAGRPRHRGRGRARPARLETAREELAAEPEFDVTVVNRRIHDAGEELVELMRSGTTVHDAVPSTPIPC